MLSTPAPHAPNFKVDSVDSSDVVLVTASLCCGACAVNIEIGGARGRSNNDIIFETRLGITLTCTKQPGDTYIGKIGLLSVAAHYITMPIADALASTKPVRVSCCALWCHDAEELINTQVLLK